MYLQNQNDVQFGMKELFIYAGESKAVCNSMHEIILEEHPDPSLLVLKLFTPYKYHKNQ